jgi:hypothetical protein
MAGMLRRWAAWVASVLGQRDTVARELRPAGRPSRGVTDRQHERDRCLYWATRNLYLGSDYGHPVSVRTARETAEQLGTPNALADYEVRPVTPR